MLVVFVIVLVGDVMPRACAEYVARADGGLEKFSNVVTARVAPQRKPRPEKRHGRAASLQAMLDATRSKFGKITVISHCRPGAKIAGTGRPSRHATCDAIDFAVRNRWRVAKWLKKRFPHNGVIVYRGGRRCHSHIHIEVPLRRGFLISKC